MKSHNLTKYSPRSGPWRLRLPFLLACVIVSWCDLASAQPRRDTVEPGRQAAEYQASMLQYAAKRGDLGTVQAMLKAGADPHATDEDGNTPLHLALQATHASSGAAVARALLTSGADPDALDLFEVTPLHLAAKRGDFGAVLVLLEFGAEPAAGDEDGDTPLHWTFLGEHALGSEVVRTLVAEGADPNAQGSRRATPLHLAAKRADLDAVKSLLEAGADPTARDEDGDTPLHWICNGDHRFSSAGVALELLGAGAEADARGSLEETPLHLAARRGHLDAVHVLLKAGANPTARDEDGDTPLYWAALGHQTEVAMALLAAERDASAVTAGAATALGVAARHGGLKVLDMLLDTELDRQLPPFSFPDAAGKPFTNSDLEGKVVLLNLWATWCGPCRSEMPWFVEFQERYGDRGFTVAAVSLDEDGWDSVRPFMRELGLNFPVLMGGDTAETYFGAIDSIPATLIIDRSGSIVFWHEGVPEKADYARQIEALL